MAWWDQLEGRERDAAAALIKLFESYGLETLAPKIIDMIQEGFGADVITLRLQDTREYKERFKGNELRARAGLPVLSPGEYLQVEAGYRQALRAAGLPEGFYDSPDDFHEFISRDVAPAEIADRAASATKVAQSLDEFSRRVVAERTGLGTGDLAAYFLDVDKALPLLEKQIEVTRLGAERQRAGFAFDEAAASDLFAQGVSVEQARRGYGLIAEQFPTLDKLGDISGEDVTVSDLEASTFGSSGEATTRLKRLASAERGRFSGSAAMSSRTLARDDRFDY